VAGPLRNRQLEPAAMALHDHHVLEGDAINQFPRWNGTRWLYPNSHLLRADLREVLRPMISDDEDYKRANDRYEYRVALLQHHLQDIPGAYRSAPGEFLGDSQWTHDDQPLVETDFRATAQQADDQWPWWQVIGGTGIDCLNTALGSFREYLAAVRRDRW
jgi:hypothetical protein